MAKIEVQILDYENSVLGTLDITDSENFPLALTYLISDGRDLESRFGDFSKSFDVPATKNNNKLFDNIYNSKIDDTKDIVGLKDCRILIDTVDFFRGKIQVKGNKQSSKPLSYSCTIFGGNYGWLSKIKNRNVCDTFDKYGELLVNGTFFVQTGISGSGNWDYGWGVGSDWVWSNGQIVWSSTTSTTTQLNQNITNIINQLVVGDKYEVSFEITSYTSGSLGGRVTDNNANTSVWTGANGVGVWSYIFDFGDAGTTLQVLNRNRFRLESEAGGFVGTVDNISLKATKTLEYTNANIISSWTDTQATNDIVYPLINYGRWINPYSVYIQGYNLKNTQQKDMRPSWYIYNLLVAMFGDVGYTLSSNFIENADFKKLICHFPPDVDTLTKLRPSEVMVSRDFWNQDSPTGGSKGIWDSSIVSTDYQVLSASNANSITNGSDTDTGWMTIKNDLIVSDINGDYNSSTGQWTCSESGSYDINSISCLIIGNFTNNQTSVENVKCRLKVYARIMVNYSPIAETTEANAQVGDYDYNNYLGNGATTASSPQYPSESKVPILNAVGVGISNSVVLNTGDVVSIDVRVKARSDSTANNVRWGVAALNDNFHTSLTGDDNFLMQFAAGGSIPSNTFLYAGAAGSASDNTINMWSHYEPPYFKITSTSSDYVWGKSYTYSDLLPCNISQVNFIKGIAHLFNLQFRTDPTSNIVYIEPYNDFYKDKSLSYDWTDKLDLSKEIEDDYNIGLNERISFQYKNDGSDGLMRYINDSFKEAGNEYNFYNYFEELGENYNKGMTKFENPVFSSTWNDWDVSVKNLTDSPPLVPVINKAESLYGWDLLYMNRWDIQRPDKMYKYNPRILLYQGYVLSPNDANLTTGWQYSPSPTSGFVQDDKTPRATFVDWDNDSGNRFTNLSFNDEIIQPPTTSTSTTVEGLYSVYWKKMIEQLKANPRIRTMHINLNSSDIATLDLSKLVYINGSYWRINKVVDYAPLKNTTTKVEFIQWI